MLRKTVTFVMLPIAAIMATAGIGYHIVAREAAEEAALKRLHASAQLTSEFLGSRIRSLESTLQATLSQEAVANYVMFANAGLLDDAERERYEIERSLLKIAGQDSSVVGISLYDKDADRFVGVENGQRNLQPESALGRTGIFAKQERATCIKLNAANQIQIWIAQRDAATGQVTAVAEANYKLENMADEAVSFAAKHLEHCRIRVLNRHGKVLYSHGDVNPLAKVIRANVPLQEVRGYVEMQHDERIALAAFYHSQSMLFLALGGVTVLLIVMTAVGTWYITGELRRNACQLQLKQEELTISRQQAISASIAKSEFLANMSHEIRTPMTAILGFTELLRAEELSQDDAAECLDTVIRNGQHLLLLINQILDLTKIEAGKLEMESAECSPQELIDDLDSLFQPQAQGKDIALEFRATGELPELIVTDPLRLKQALVNLVANAIKFTNSGSVRVATHCDWKRETLTFEVCDTGIGMSKSQLECIFQPFIQADSSTTRLYGGTGLGLSITKQITNQLGGSIRVWSELHRGSRFVLEVPTGPLIVRKRKALALTVPHAEQQTTRSEPSPPLPSSASVLLVEDGRDNQRLLKHILQKIGVETTVADNGQAGVAVALEANGLGRPFELILMDLQMPVMDGYEATATLRAAGYEGQIVALTAHALSSDLQRCIANGFDGYITKPIDRERFVDEILRRVHDPRRSSPLVEPSFDCADADTTASFGELHTTNLSEC